MTVSRRATPSARLQLCPVAGWSARWRSSSRGEPQGSVMLWIIGQAMPERVMPHCSADRTKMRVVSFRQRRSKRNRGTTALVGGRASAPGPACADAGPALLVRRQCLHDAPEELEAPVRPRCPRLRQSPWISRASFRPERGHRLLCTCLISRLVLAPPLCGTVFIVTSVSGRPPGRSSLLGCSNEMLSLPARHEREQPVSQRCASNEQ